MQVQAWFNRVSKTVGYWSRRTVIQVSDSVADTKSWREGVNVSVTRVGIAVRDTLAALGLRS